MVSLLKLALRKALLGIRIHGELHARPARDYRRIQPDRNRNRDRVHLGSEFSSPLDSCLTWGDHAVEMCLSRDHYHIDSAQVGKPSCLWRTEMDVRNRTEFCLIAAAVLVGIIVGFTSLIPA
jgi:hypothetical protein